MAFDLLHLDGRSLLLVPLEDRKRLLRSVLREHARVRFAAHVTGDGKAFYEAAAGRGLEGIVAKQRTSRYEPGRRSRAWLKIKIRPEQELVVGGYIPGEGSARDLGALLVGGVRGRPSSPTRARSAAGSTAGPARRCASGSTRSSARRPPFDPPPARSGELREAHWAEPEIVIRAEFADWTRDGTDPPGRLQGLSSWPRSARGRPRAGDRLAGAGRAAAVRRRTRRRARPDDARDVADSRRRHRSGAAPRGEPADPSHAATDRDELDALDPARQRGHLGRSAAVSSS